MTVITFQNRGLYVLVATGSILLFLIALGPGLFHEFAHLNTTWQFKVFDILCHQDFARSYSLNESQMAVCARCIGIYGAFSIGVLLMPLFAQISQIKGRYYFKLMMGTIILNFIDVGGNLLEVWTNTNESRLILGILFGISVALFLTNEFFEKLNAEESYGK